MNEKEILISLCNALIARCQNYGLIPTDEFRNRELADMCGCDEETIAELLG